MARMIELVVVACVVVAGTAGAGPVRHPDPGGASRRCAKVLREGDKLDGEARMRAMLEGCQELPAEPGCRQAYAKAAKAERKEIIPTLIDGCRKVYCPSFPEPVPALCHADLAKETPDALLEDWSEFLLAMMKQDMGGAPPVELSEAMHDTVARMRAGSGAPVTVRIRLGPKGGLLLSMLNGDGGTLQDWRTPEVPDAGSLGQLKAAVKRLAPGGGVVLLEVAREVKYRSLRAVTTVLAPEGYQLQVRVPSPAGAKP